MENKYNFFKDDLPVGSFTFTSRKTLKQTVYFEMINDGNGYKQINALFYDSVPNSIEVLWRHFISNKKSGLMFYPGALT